jgi:hypothetical protein
MMEVPTCDARVSSASLKMYSTAARILLLKGSFWTGSGSWSSGLSLARTAVSSAKLSAETIFLGCRSDRKDLAARYRGSLGE